MHLHSSEILALISFFVVSVSGFGIGVLVASQDESGSVPPSLVFGLFKKDTYKFFLVCLVEFPSEVV